MPTNPIIPKTNATTGSSVAPTAAALITGEVASNKFTGDLYLKKEDGTVEQIGSDASKLSKGTMPSGRLPAMSGDVSSNAGSNSLTVAGLRGKPLAPTTVSDGQAYVYNQTNARFEPESIVTYPIALSSISFNNGAFGFRNRIINPDFKVDQRLSGGTQALTQAMAYTVDRWAVGTTQAISGALQVQQVSVFPNEMGSPQMYALKITRTTAGASANNIRIAQVIESIHCADIAGKTVTVSVAFRSTGLAGSDMSISVVYGTGLDEGLAGAIAGTWTGYGIAGLFPSIDSSGQGNRQTATFSANIPTLARELAIIIVTNGSLSLNSSFELGCVQLEQGSVSTPFEIRPLPIERGLCQRYFQRISDIHVEGYLAAGLTRVSMPFPLAVAMRTTPTRAVVTTGTMTNIRSNSTTYAGLTPRSAAMATAFVESAAAGFTAVTGQVETLSAEL